MKRLASMLLVVSAVWLTLALVTPIAGSSAAVDTADASIPVDAATTLEMRAAANCIKAEGNCLFNTSANLRVPEGPIGFPNDLWARQTTTLRTMHRTVWLEADFDAPNTRMFKSITNVEFTTIYFGGVRWRSFNSTATPGQPTGALGSLGQTPTSSSARTSRWCMPG